MPLIGWNTLFILSLVDGNPPSVFLTYVGISFGRIDSMDPAALRPGRFGQHLYVPLPNSEERGVILKTLGRNKPIDARVDLRAIG